MNSDMRSQVQSSTPIDVSNKTYGLISKQSLINAINIWGLILRNFIIFNFLKSDTKEPCNFKEAGTFRKWPMILVGVEDDFLHLKHQDTEVLI